MSAASPLRHVARKRFGQHFLTDRSVISAIVHAVDPRPGERLVEIGPGRAALTTALIERVEPLTAIEIDRDLAGWLRSRFGERLQLIEQDVLTVDFADLAGDGAIRLVGNLPYNISSPLLVHLIAFRERIVDQHFMLQKEVVERIVAAPGEGAYGRLGVLLQNYYDVDALFDVAPQSFDPPPKVMSAVLRLLPRTGDEAPPLEALEPLLARAFGQRRKMLRNTLLPWLDEHGVAAPELTPSDRAEDVPVAVYRLLAMRLAQASRDPGGAQRSISSIL